MDQHLITRIVEAALLAAHQPLTLAQLHGLFAQDQPAPADSVEQALETLREGCADRGVELVELASGFRYQVQADVHPWVARLWTERQTRYTRATLETLALIAYRQPVTRGEIEQVRGVAVSTNIIKSLEEREWIRVVGHRDVPGRPALFGTTKVFLDYFGLKRLDQLPPLSELSDLGELEPQFEFHAADAQVQPIAAARIAAGNGTAGSGADDAGNDDDGIDDSDTGDDAPDRRHADPINHEYSDNNQIHDASTSPPALGADVDSEPEAAPGERAAGPSGSDITDPVTAPGTQAAATTRAADPHTSSNDTDDTETASSEQQK